MSGISARGSQVLIPLLVLFLVFVVLDVSSTIWLVNNAPGGLEGEANPVGVALYGGMGAAGLIFPKFALFILFAGMTYYFSEKFSERKWFLEAAETLVLAQIALSLIVSFNNFIAILATFYVNGVWPLVYLPANLVIIGIYGSDLALGAIFANGVMYLWGVKNLNTHLKVFVSLMVFITPVLLFAAGFRAEVWLFAIYIAAASTAVGLFFYSTEAKSLGNTGAIRHH